MRIFGSCKSPIRVAVIVGFILPIPLILTLLNPNASIYGGPGGGWDWGPLDFPLMGALLFTTGMAIDFVARRVPSRAMRVLGISAIILTCLAIWVELAVDGVSQFLATYL